MPPILITNAQYDKALCGQIYHMLDTLAKDRIFPGARVLIKPNLLLPADPTQGILTHPLVVQAAAGWALRHGARIQVSDSPAIGPFDRVLNEGGFRDACRGMDIDWRAFARTTTVDIGPPFGRIALAADILDADLVINLAKLKTHVMMGLTLGVKNMFGCVVGMKKTEWHLQAGVDRDLFATLLVRICAALAPAVTLMDGILALEGDGPGKSGTPRRVGLLAGGTDPVALDYVVAGRVGAAPGDLPIHQAAVRLGLFKGPPEVSGTAVAVPDFRIPRLGSAGFGPKPFQKLMRRHLLRRPVANETLCRVCGLCGRQCPARAITTEKERIVFDYDQCIRCYCCIEVCPHGALSTSDPLAGRMVRQLGTWGRSGWKRLRKP